MNKNYEIGKKPFDIIKIVDYKSKKPTILEVFI